MTTQRHDHDDNDDCDNGDDDDDGDDTDVDKHLINKHIKHRLMNTGNLTS